MYQLSHWEESKYFVLWSAKHLSSQIHKVLSGTFWQLCFVPLAAADCKLASHLLSSFPLSFPRFFSPLSFYIHSFLSDWTTISVSQKSLFIVGGKLLSGFVPLHCIPRLLPDKFWSWKVEVKYKLFCKVCKLICQVWQELFFCYWLTTSFIFLQPNATVSRKCLWIATAVAMQLKATHTLILTTLTRESRQQ